MDTDCVRAILGLLIADGSLVRYYSPSGGYIQLTLTAGARDAAFLDEKVAEIKKFFPTKAGIIPYRTPKRANGKQNVVLRFRVSSSKLRPIYNLLYPGGEREITAVALQLLGARAIAWLWADASRPAPGGGFLLTKAGYTETEARLVSGWIRGIIGSQSKVITDERRPRLFFDDDSAVILRERVAPYSPASRSHLFEHDFSHGS